MPGAHSLILYIGGAILVGVALDWAIFERVKIIVGPYGDSDEVRYRDLPPWRTLMVCFASSIVGASLAAPVLPVAPFWAGALMLAALNGYADRIGIKGRPITDRSGRNVR